MNDLKGGIKSRVMIIRLRTWTLSVTIIALLVLYIFVTLGIKEKLDWIDFVITTFIQISTHFAYFPDGERYGETDPMFVSARNAYNTNADRITRESTIADLRDYCEYDFKERTKKHISDACGKIGIAMDEYELLAQKSIDELKVIELFEHNGKIVRFDKSRRRALIKIVYGKNPVKPNSPDIILSAVDRDYAEAIKDRSQFYKKTRHAKRLFRSIIVGGILAYIGYNVRDGLSFAAIVKSAVFIGSMISTAVSSYIAGEKASKEYRRKFYVELSVFIDKFFSWLGVKKPAVPDEENTAE